MEPIPEISYLGSGQRLRWENTESLAVLLGETVWVQEAPAGGNLGDRGALRARAELGVYPVEPDRPDVGGR